MTKSFTKKLYETHHAQNRTPGFSILKEERGKLFSQIVGMGKDVLDLGCRDGALTLYFKEGNNVLGVDIDSFSLAKASELGIPTKEMDIYGDWLELEGRKFEVVVMGEVLEHLFYPEDIIKKVAGVLKEGGVFVGSVPNAFSLRNRLRYLMGQKKYTPLSDPTHINQFSRKDLVQVLSKSFKFIEIKPLGKFAWFDKLWPGMFSFDLVWVAK